MNSIKRLITLIVLLMISLSVEAQEEDKLGSWYVYNGFFNFNPKLELFLESQLRTWEPITNIQNLFFRPYLSYNFTPNVQVGLGQEYHMAWTFAENKDDKVKTEEYRTTLQVMLFHKVNRVSIQHRYRYEFRFLDEAGNQRTRYRIQLGIPITDKNMGKGVVFTTLGNEIMVDTQNELALSQMRSYAMLGYQFSNTTHFQFGYMYISRPSADGLHRLQFFLTQRLAFYD